MVDLLHVQPERNMLEKNVFEPSEQEVNHVLQVMYLCAKMYLMLYRSIVAEHTCRVIAMDSASKNASDMAQELQTIFNKTRQEKVTKEILEITTSAESFSND